MNTRLLIAVLALFVLLPLKEQAFGKCALLKYTITGTLQDELTTQPISNASIFFFFDDYKSTLSEGYFTKYPDFFTTDGNGIFVATAYFNTYSGWLFFDRCNRKPKTLTVIIAAPGYLTKRVIFKRKDLNIGEETSDQRIELPSILLHPSKQ